MNLLNFFRNIYSRIRIDSNRLGIKEIGEYKKQIEKLYDDMETLGDRDFIDRLVSSMGIANTAKEYNRLNSYYKDYYKKIFKSLADSPSTSNNTKQLAKRAKEDWDKTFKESILYLYKLKQQTLWGEYDEAVKSYSSNAFCDDHELPLHKKEEINEDYFNEGLKGVTLGGLSGAALAILIRSLGLAFRIPPAALVGVSTALGAAVGQFIQKHFFIDFTNYTKLKRYIESEPQAYEAILELMAKNATKFQQKDRIKYKKILANLKRLRRNPPRGYEDFLDDDEYDDDDAFDVAYDTEYTIKRGGGRGYSQSDYRQDFQKGYGQGFTQDFDLDDTKGLFKNNPDDINDLMKDILR